jgi:uncharacterized protein YkwD
MTYDLGKLIKLHNDARSKSWWTLKPLSRDERLMEYAQDWADTMAKRNRMVHSSMRDVLQLGFAAAGENIAWNQQSEEAVMSAWLWSPGHRWNIMGSSYNAIGCGVADAGRGPYWCVVFGRPKPQRATWRPEWKA